MKIIRKINNNAAVAQDRKGREMAVIGIGVSNLPLIRFLADCGVKVTAHDKRTPEQLAEIAANVVVDDAVLSQLKEGRIAPSPGMKYKHYAPKADVILVQGDSESFLTYVKAHRADGVYALAYASDMAALESAGIACMSYGDTEEIQASLLFARLREADAVGAKRVYVRAPHKDGVGLAVYNRLIRSSGYHLEVV